MARFEAANDKSCPVCRQRNMSTRSALLCWLGHDPDLPVTLTLQRIGDQLGVTRERVRQLLDRIGEQRRARSSQRFEPRL